MGTDIHAGDLILIFTTVTLVGTHKTWHGAFLLFHRSDSLWPLVATASRIINRIDSGFGILIRYPFPGVRPLYAMTGKTSGLILGIRRALKTTQDPALPASARHRGSKP
jgi:hypothetical protein